MSSWWEPIVIGFLTGSGGGIFFARILSPRKARAETSNAEAEATANWQKNVAAANEEMEKARKDGETWYAALQAVRAEMDARVEAATAPLKKQNAELMATVAVMARQLDQRTANEAEVALARRQIQRTDQLETENATLREQVAEIPALRQEVADLRIEVASLRTQLDEAQREQRADHEVMRETLDKGGPPNG